MKVLVLVLITLCLSVPTYAKTYNHETSKEIVLKGKVLAFGLGVGISGMILSVKYKGRLFTCSHLHGGKVYYHEHFDGE